MYFSFYKWKSVLITSYNNLSKFPAWSPAIDRNAKNHVIWPVLIADLDHECKQNKSLLIV